jgi:uncharacterized paraquat-inducible protein A
MPVVEQPRLILCQKCGMQAELKMFRRKDSRACPLCSEPLRELINLDACSWEEGDFTPPKDVA